MVEAAISGAGSCVARCDRGERARHASLKHASGTSHPSALEWAGLSDEANELFSDPSTLVPPLEPDAPSEEEGEGQPAGDFQEPKKTVDVKPEYPDRAGNLGTQGVVILQTTIEEDGSIGPIRVEKGLRGLTGQAITAVRQWKYEPATLDGEPIAVNFTLTVNFQLGN